MGWRNLVLASSAERWIVPRLAIDVYLQNVPNLFVGKQVRLRLRGQVDHPKRTMRAQAGGDGRSGALPGGVTVEHENHASEPFQQCTLLRWVERRPHQRHYCARAGLIHLHAIEETFDQHYRSLSRRGGTVEVEQDLRFGEARRKSVARLRPIQRTTAVGDESPRWL